ncbi:glycosyltransferase [uncultured Alsobacter sp.]|uniref:glycosyltransferase n=1 Tax=uncultured Alsobacter sp. TaxID=1748258 RepID=UPI0025FB4800|nr:glycosyltransferase [uncultured Alsobacter sp.]
MSPHVLTVAYPFAPVGPDAVGGAEQIAAALDAALVEAGCRSTVVACAGSVVSGVLRSVPAHAGRIEETARLSIHAHVRAAIDASLMEDDVDLVHLHGIDAAETLPPPGVPALLTLHLPVDWYPPALIREPPADLTLVPVSASQAQGLPPEARAVPPIENGVPVEDLARARHARRGFALVLGRVCPEKGVHLALDAAIRAEIPCLVAGETFNYAAHRRYFDDEVLPRLDRQRRWLGPVDFQRKRRLLSAARCVLIPSLVPETSSLVAREAAACGTPVIAFRAGALPDTVEDGRTGFIVDDVAGMAAAISRCDAIDPEVCRGVARRRFSLRAMTDAYLALYRRTVAAGAA